MSVDFKKLSNFVKIIDTSSLSKAAAALRVAQPALSQQVIALETHFKQKLIIRGNQGVKPTAAGKLLYSHAQSILRHLERAQAEISATSEGLAGRVSVGLATYSPAASVTVPFLQRMKAIYPNILVHINDNFGQILSDLVMTGRMDLAIIYGDRPIKGVSLEKLLSEDLYFIGPHPETRNDQQSVELEELRDVPLILPSKQHALRWLIDEGFTRARVQPHVTTEIESISTLTDAVLGGIGSTILPYSTALSIASDALSLRHLTHPTLEVHLSMCMSDHLPLSEAALATRDVLRTVLQEFLAGADTKQTNSK
ncbi:nitrogen assimilation transcriptional regulator NAC [Gluconobacter cerinus]|uniref:nitrogen assimilation transcriptional regulator NAC n=1 Tax=Gluconobacter cerinus TaxID=38307 RepID=UPI001B8C4A88|nr:nitrogen assimilation transcriptional regulator NAC [Gluconobacter cerinus]MBS1032138.1 nitrogen assimilation transcriptional regulator NAC [Gluconobacter cerinus]